MDKADAPFLAADTSPAYLNWRERRASIKPSDGPNADIANQRLYSAHMYTDDPIIGVVGAQRA
eukprot:2078371-Pleurochrysis_carterae.AAC.1